MEFNDLGGDVFFSTSGQALIEFTSAADNPRRTDDIPGGYQLQEDRKHPWVPWYDPDNQFPGTCLGIILKNNILSGILGTMVDFLLGSGVTLFRETTDTATGKRSIELVRDNVIEAWLERSNFNEVVARRYLDKLFFGNEFCELLFTEGGMTPRQVHSVSHLDAMTVRSGWKNRKTGKVEHFFVCPNWKKPEYDPKARGAERQKQNVRLVPAFDPETPTKYERGILHGRGYMPGYPYYPVPFWYPTEEWIQLASKIPRWHSKGIDNGYNIRVHVKIPKSWLDQFPAEQRETKKAEVRAQMDDFLAGADGAGKAFFSTYSNAGGLPDGWSIEPIDNKLNDEAYTALYAQSNQAVVSGLGMDPTLAGIMLEGKIGNASEKRIAYAIHMALRTPRPRMAMLDVLYKVGRINGWDPTIRFGFKDIELTTLDQAPTGQKEVTAV